MLKPIKDFPGYFVTEKGEVHSTRIIGRTTRPQPMRRLKAIADKTGRKRVSLMKNGGAHVRSIARLVLETFVSPRPSGMLACHGPNRVADDSVNNLSWGTYQSNADDKQRDGTLLYGDKHPSSKLNSLQVRIIRRAYRRYGVGGLSGYELAKVFNVGPKTINDIVRMQHWKQVQSSAK